MSLFVHPQQIQKLIHCLEYDEVQITLAKKIEKAETIADINTPKVFFDEQMNASTFERDVSHKTDKYFYKHIGLYGYKTTILKQITALAPTHNEKQNAWNKCVGSIMITTYEWLLPKKKVFQ